jgi:hypothetical protein
MGEPYRLFQDNSYTLNFSAGFPSQPDQDAYLQHIRAYRGAVQNAARMLLRTDWSKFDAASEGFQAIQSQLKDAIDNLGALGADPMEDRVDMQAVLNFLYDVVAALYRASERLGERNFSTRSSRFEEFGECHKKLIWVTKLLDI